VREENWSGIWSREQFTNPFQAARGRMAVPHESSSSSSSSARRVARPVVHVSAAAAIRRLDSLSGSPLTQGSCSRMPGSAATGSKASARWTGGRWQRRQSSEGRRCRRLTETRRVLLVRSVVRERLAALSSPLSLFYYYATMRPPRTPPPPRYYNGPGRDCTAFLR
jgi:hypothetical protein